jgi:hypothetical protein
MSSQEFDTMLELRQRSRSSGSSHGGYIQVSTDDELDSIPLLDQHRPKFVPIIKSTICKLFTAARHQ